MQQQHADVLLLCGDVTNQGRTSQHELLRQKLQSLEKTGTKVYVLPGNHDMDGTSQNDFDTIYQSFGYGNCHSRDERSLSYSVLARDCLILMMDTNGYHTNFSEAYIPGYTLTWAKEQMELAQQNGWQVIIASHYPLITQHNTPFTGRQAVLGLFSAYRMPLYLCGHLHQRSVISEQEVTELVVEQAISYPCSYALLTVNGLDEIRYTPQTIDVESWAEAHSLNNPDLLHFSTYQQKQFQQQCKSILSTLIGSQTVSSKDKELMTDFFLRFMQEFAQGNMGQCAQQLTDHPGYAVFMHVAGQSNYGHWIPGVLSNANAYTRGFTIEQGKLLPIP